MLDRASCIIRFDSGFTSVLSRIMEHGGPFKARLQGYLALKENEWGVFSLMKIKRKSGELFIAVCGHRSLKDEERISIGVIRALEYSLKQYKAENLGILSSLAEGADRLVWRVAHTRTSARLIVVLPLSEEEYSKDFNLQSQQEFTDMLFEADQVLEADRDVLRPDAYIQAEEVLLGECDVLLVLWDGEEAHGRGGTADVVADARKKKLPVAWVYSLREDQKPAEGVLREPGEVRYERFPEE